MDNKNFWRLVDWIRWHHMWYEPSVGTKQLLRTARSLMKEYRRRKSYYGDTWEVFNDFLKQCVDPYMRNIKEEAYAKNYHLRKTQIYVSNGDQQTQNGGRIGAGDASPVP